MEVYCHPCARNVAGQRTSAGDLHCTVCQSDFCEAIERVPAASVAPSIPPPSTFSTSELFVSSWTIDATSLPGATGTAEQQQQGPRAQVMIIQETTPLTGELLQLLGGQGNTGGIQLGDYASSDQIEQIMTRLLAAHAPPRQPTSRKFLESLPRLPVSPLDSEGAARKRDDAAALGSTDKAAETTPQPTEPRYAFCCSGDTCTICHEAYKPSEQVVELPCQHCFHEECILPWLGEHNDCPVCRRKFEVETQPLDHGVPAPATSQPEAREAQARRLNPASQHLAGFLDRRNRQRRAGPGQNQQADGTSARVRQQQHSALRTQLAALRTQHEATLANVQELQRSSQQQLHELLQQHSASSEVDADGRVATPFADLASRLRTAQRAVDLAQEHVQVFENLMTRLGYLPSEATPPAGGQQHAEAGAGAAPAQGARTDAESVSGGAAESASREAPRGLPGQQDQGRRGSGTRTAEAAQHRLQQQQRRLAARAPVSARYPAAAPWQQQQEGGGAAAAVDLVMNFPVFSVTLRQSPAVSMERFMQPLTDDDPVAVAQGAAADHAAPAPVPAPAAADGDAPDAGAGAGAASNQAAAVGMGAGAGLPESSASGSGGALGLVGGGLALPWRMASMLLGGLFGRRNARTQ